MGGLVFRGVGMIGKSLPWLSQISYNIARFAQIFRYHLIG